MTSLQLAAPALAAAAVDVAARTAEGLLVPWDEPGKTNLGTGVRVRPNGLRLAAEHRVEEQPVYRVIGINGHNREQPVSRLIAAEVRPEGIWGRLRIAETPAGDQLLAEIRAGIRDGLSVEADELVFDAAGDIVDGLVNFVAHVPRGAYDSARVHQLAAALHAPNPSGEPSVTAPPVVPAPAEPLAPAAPAIDYAALAQALAPALQAAAAPAGLSLGGVPPAAAPAEGRDPVMMFAELQAALYSKEHGKAAELKAALADITYSSVDLFKQPAGTIGEKLWEGGGYERQFTRLMRPKPLTSYKFKSWQWVNRPKVEAWAGDKTPIPTNTVSVEEFEHTATRIAGGWDIDRALRDFPNPDFWAEFLAAGVESYREVSDLQAAAAIVAFARDVTVDGNVPASYTGINIAPEATATGLLKAVALGTAIMEDTPRVRKGPDYVMVNTAEWLRLIDLTNLDLPSFLALMKVRPENFMRTDQVPAGSVVMGVTQAMTFRELGGSSPIRVEALDVAKGGIDEALFGYVGISGDRPGGVIEVPLVAPGG